MLKMNASSYLPIPENIIRSILITPAVDFFRMAKSLVCSQLIDVGSYWDSGRFSAAPSLHCQRAWYSYC